MGLAPGTRYRCAQCGNLTRFDVRTTERLSRFWHFDLSGAGTPEEQEIRDLEIEEVRCRWCNTGDGVHVVRTPGPEAADA
ncbi:hypothetical protein ER308_00595 [Egibacter rhizosphaerae]|uniref:Uncharacterized protein n=1 Tax=Egibacter rhizosphaerae TaxID=1670831 RepID=A0A411YKU6_9ACTN|nr:hypothetical protein ER308_00595 [Egibacter rhizosphaerae]